MLDNAVLPATNSAKKSCFAKSLTQSVEKEGKIRMSVQQARRFLRDSNSDSYSSHIEQFTLVESLLLQLQNVDPLGVYYLKTQPLRYEVSGSSPLCCHTISGLTFLLQKSQNGIIGCSSSDK